MKIIYSFLLLGALSVVPCQNYQPPEDGLVSTPALLQRASRVFEKKSDGSRSNVVSVRGFEQFRAHVLSASTHNPVVVMISMGKEQQLAGKGGEQKRRGKKVVPVHDPLKSMSEQERTDDAQRMKDSLRMLSVFYDLADVSDFKERVTFANIVLDGTNPDNQQIVAQLMHSENVSQLSLPIFFFFKGGTLYATEGSPAIVHGADSKENLAHFIRKKFFPMTLLGSSVPVHDVTVTTTTGH